MKTLIFLSLVLVLVSCGKGGGGGNTPVLNPVMTDELDCLEKTLQWIENPPADKKEAFRKMSQVSFEKCGASNEVLDLYIKKINWSQE